MERFFFSKIHALYAFMQLRTSLDVGKSSRKVLETLPEIFVKVRGRKLNLFFWANLRVFCFKECFKSFNLA